MKGQYHDKIEKSRRHGKALRMTCYFLLCIAVPQITGPHRLSARSMQMRLGTFRTGGELRERGPRAAAMGGCAAAVQGGAETALYNPAMITGSTGGGVLLWTPARFGMTELGSAAGAWLHPFQSWVAAVSVQQYGYELYAEHRMDLSAAIPIGPALSAGLRISALHIEISRYGSTLVPLVDAGVRCGIAEGLEAAAVGFALNMPAIAPDERMPAGLCAGLAWTHDGLLLTLDCEKEARHPMNLRFGAEYGFLEHFALRCGTATVSRTWTAGFAVRRGALRFEYAAAIHTELGATHTVGIGFEP